MSSRDILSDSIIYNDSESSSNNSESEASLVDEPGDNVNGNHTNDTNNSNDLTDAYAGNSIANESDVENEGDDEHNASPEYNNKRIILQKFTIYNSLTTMYIVGSNAKRKFISCVRNK